MQNPTLALIPCAWYLNELFFLYFIEMYIGDLLKKKKEKIDDIYKLEYYTLIHDIGLVRDQISLIWSCLELN